MYKINFKLIYADEKIDLMGFQKPIKEDNWGIKIEIDGQLESIEECIEIIEEYEEQLEELSLKTTVCKECGHCCLHGPEISSKEINYYISKFPEYRLYYEGLKSGEPCEIGGIGKYPCLLPKEARPLQCRLLYCEANIVGFESFYNFIGEYLSWTTI